MGPSTRTCATRAGPSTSAISDKQALEAFGELARLEGIIPALESSHAIAWLLENPGEGGFDVLCLSGRGDKDMAEYVEQVEKGVGG